MRIAIGLSAVLLAGLTASPRGVADDDRLAEKPEAPVFLSGLGRGEGAPSAEALNDLVILSEVPGTSPWFASVEAFGRKDVKEVVPFRPDRLETAFRRLAELKPGFVVVLVLPGTLDVNFHFEFLERASRLDDDPFVDFAFGYLTGATPEEATAFADGIARARATELPGVILEFGPNSKPRAVSKGGPVLWARSVTERTLAHPENASDVAELLKEIPGIGIYRASGHGTPDRVIDGLTGTQIRESGLQLWPALYISGPCWCGVTGAWFETSGGGVKRNVVPAAESFLLALVNARATGVLASLDPDRGETSHMELEHLLSTGDPLGMVAKSTWDDAALSYRRREFVLPRYRDGKGKPTRDIHDNMISGGASRALFGDPSFIPFAAAGPPMFTVTTERTKRGLEILCRYEGDRRDRWGQIEVFRAGGGWSHRIRFRHDLPVEELRKVRGFQVLSVSRDGEEIPFIYPTLATESWGEGARLHGMVVFERKDGRQALSGAKVIEARFLLRE